MRKPMFEWEYYYSTMYIGYQAILARAERSRQADGSRSRLCLDSTKKMSRGPDIRSTTIIYVCTYSVPTLPIACGIITASRLPSVGHRCALCSTTSSTPQRPHPRTATGEKRRWLTRYGVLRQRIGAVTTVCTDERWCKTDDDDAKGVSLSAGPCKTASRYVVVGCYLLWLFDAAG